MRAQTPACVMPGRVVRGVHDLSETAILETQRRRHAAPESTLAGE